MKKIFSSVVVLAGLLFAGQASAHVGYRSLDALNPFTASVTSDHGWYDGTQPTLGNSHDIRFFSFTLTQDSFVDISVANAGAGDLPNYTGAGVLAATPTFTSAGDIDVGFSLYSGLLPTSAFEGATFNGSPVYPAAPGNNGLFDAEHDITMGNNSGVIDTITHIAHKNDFGIALTESLNGQFLHAGSYTLAVGGATGGGTNTGTFGVTASLDVQPVPVPGAVWLFGSAMAGLIGLGRRKAAVAA